MELTIVVAMFRMAREVPRTLFTFSAANQTGMNVDDYEIIVVDNGSPEPLSEAQVAAFPSNASYRYIETTSMSPAAAINNAIATSTTPYVGCVIDGARMVSPGVVSQSLDALRAHPRRFVYCPSFHLGRQLQNDSVMAGYDQRAEDALLASVDWRANGYLLFEISNVAATPERLMLPTFESNCFFLSRALWDEIGGYDERFESAGGGLVNWDYFKRAVELDGVETVSLLGEASFHQFHGGASTNHVRKNHPVRGWFREYEAIVGKPFRYPKYRPRVVGVLSDFLASVVYGPNSLTAAAVAGELSTSGLHHEAVEVLRHRAKNEPNNPTALQDLALSFINANRLQAALATVDAAIAIAPTQAELYATRARVLRLMGRLDDARSAVAEAMGLDPLQYEAQFELGLIERVQESPEDAIIAFETAIELNGEIRGDYAMQLVTALSVTGHHERAQEIAYRWFDQAPRDISARLDYIEALKAAGRDHHANDEAHALLDVLPSVVMDRGTHRRAVEILADIDGVVQRLRTAVQPREAVDELASNATVVVAPGSSCVDHSMVPVPEVFDRFEASVDAHYDGVGDASSRREHALGASIRETDATALGALVAEVAPQRVVVIGAFLGLSTAIITNFAPPGATVDAIDPSVRHRIFDDPLGHAERFLSHWASTKTVMLSRLYFGTRSIGPAIYDLTHYSPEYEFDDARQLAETPAMAHRYPEEADLVFVDVGLADAELVRVARAALGIARAGAPVVFGSTNLPGVPDLLELIGETQGTTTQRLRSNTQVVAGRRETIVRGEGPLVLRKPSQSLRSSERVT